MTVARAAVFYRILSCGRRRKETAVVRVNSSDTILRGCCIGYLKAWYWEIVQKSFKTYTEVETVIDKTEAVTPTFSEVEIESISEAAL